MCGIARESHECIPFRHFCAFRSNFAGSRISGYPGSLSGYPGYIPGYGTGYPGTGYPGTRVRVPVLYPGMTTCIRQLVYVRINCHVERFKVFFPAQVESCSGKSTPVSGYWVSGYLGIRISRLVAGYPGTNYPPGSRYLTVYWYGYP